VPHEKADGEKVGEKPGNDQQKTGGEEGGGLPDQARRLDQERNQLLGPSEPSPACSQEEDPEGSGRREFEENESGPDALTELDQRGDLDTDSQEQKKRHRRLTGSSVRGRAASLHTESD